MHIEIRTFYRYQTRALQYTKKDFNRLVTPIMEAYNAQIIHRGCEGGMGFIVYNVPVDSIAHAITFREAFAKALNLLGKQSYGFYLHK